MKLYCPVCGNVVAERVEIETNGMPVSERRRQCDSCGVFLSIRAVQYPRAGPKVLKLEVVIL